ncbi:MAG: tagaturonate reductase [Bacteroidaceae bacterium]|nr:tagaturonate reductase [Bacteroidaceae bacterium]
MSKNVKIVQFGEGNFLRAFVDWMMLPDTVAVVKPRPGAGLERLTAHGCRYEVCLQGQLDGQLVDTTEQVCSIACAINPYEDVEAFWELAVNPQVEFVISNTTEAGIVFDPSCRLSDAPALSYPGKLVQFLYKRYKGLVQTATAAGQFGVTILPCELIFHNGKHLKECMHQYMELWQLPEDFRVWADACCPVYNTLVDRIVPGGPDYYKVVAEPYHLWVIEGPEALRERLPLRSGELNLVLTADENPYHLRKVTLLNGPHTAMSAVGHLAGLETVRECMLHPVVGKYVERVMMQELLPTVPLPEAEMLKFADSVKDRFLNPFVKHALTSIMLNNISKFVTRDLPAMRWHFCNSGVLPQGLVIALAANLICAEIGADGDLAKVTDAEGFASKLASGLADAQVWGADLTAEMPGLREQVESIICRIVKEGMLSVL